MARITGKPVADTLFGTAGNDDIFGLGGGDELYGAATIGAVSGNNSFHGGAGNDLMYGGDGKDVFYLEGGTDLISGGTGIDTIDYSSATAGFQIDLTGNSGSNSTFDDNIYLIEVVIGSAFNDTLIGGYQPDSALYGAGGGDILQGHGYADRLFGGIGNDVIRADEALYGSSEGDFIRGGRGFDDIYGSEEADQLFGDDGNDTIYGGKGTDVIDGGKGGDWLAANGGDDSVQGGKGADTFFFSGSELGHRVVLDFKVAQGDNLYFEFGGNITSMAQLLPRLTEDNGDLVIQMDQNGSSLYSVTLLGVAIADLSDANVAFWHF